MESEIEEFWTMLSSENEQIQEEGYQRWRNFLRSHPKHFDTIKEKLPKSFSKVYQSMNLHDFHVLDIASHSNPPRMSHIKLLLHDYHEDYGKNLHFNIIYRNVKYYSLSVKSTKFAMSWSRDIFEIVDGNLLKHRILCSDGTSIDIVFQKISIVKLKQIHSDK